MKRIIQQDSTQNGFSRLDSVDQFMADLGISADTRPLTIGYDWVRFERADER